VDDRARRVQLAAVSLAVALAVLGLTGCSFDHDDAPSPAPLPLPRTEVSGTRWNGDIAVAGGFVADGSASNRADLYSVKRNRWRPLPKLPIKVHHSALAVLGDRLYLVGGYTTVDGQWQPSPRVLSLGDGDGRWRNEPPMPAGRGAHAVVALGGRLIAVGGVVGGAATNTTAVFDGKAWRDGPAFGRPREHLAAASTRDRVFVIAGRAPDNFTDVESWDGVAPAWQSEPPLNDSRAGIGADAIGGMPCVAGGEAPSGTIASVECLQDGRWERLASLRHPRHGLVVVAVGNDLHVIGGGPKPGLTVSATHEVLRIPEVFDL
jgi:hypothetical protein